MIEVSLENCSTATLQQVQQGEIFSGNAAFSGANIREPQWGCRTFAASMMLKGTVSGNRPRGGGHYWTQEERSVRALEDSRRRVITMSWPPGAAGRKENGFKLKKTHNYGKDFV